MVEKEVNMETLKLNVIQKNQLSSFYNILMEEKVWMDKLGNLVKEVLREKKAETLQELKIVFL